MQEQFKCSLLYLINVQTHYSGHTTCLRNTRTAVGHTAATESKSLNAKRENTRRPLVCDQYSTKVYPPPPPTHTHNIY